MNGLLGIVAEQIQQLPESNFTALRLQDQTPPLFQAMRNRVTVGEPTIDVLQRNAQQRRIRFDLVRNSFVQFLHDNGESSLMF